jgi:hypothetical protein
MLVTSDFLPYSAEIRNLVVAQRPNLEGDYLAYRWREVRLEIELSQLALHTVLVLSKSKAPTIQEKIKIWSSVASEALISDSAALAELTSVCSEANEEKLYFPDSYIAVLRTLVSAQGLTSDQRIELLVQCMPLMNWLDVSVLLGELSETGFRKLSPKIRKIEISYSGPNFRLVEALKARGFLNTITHSGQVIKATSKPSGMK